MVRAFFGLSTMTSFTAPSCEKMAYSHVVAVALASVMPWMHPIEPTATRP